MMGLALAGAVVGAIASLPPAYPGLTVAAEEMRAASGLRRYRAARFVAEYLSNGGAVYPAALDPLIDGLAAALGGRQPQTVLRAADAVQALHAFGDLSPAVRPLLTTPLKSLLADSDPAVRRCAAVLLARLDPLETNAAVASLRKLCNSAGDREFVSTVVTLRQMIGVSADEAGRLLAERFEGLSVPARVEVCSAVDSPLFRGSVGPLLPKIRAAVRSPDPALRCAAARAVFRSGPKYRDELVEPVAELLKVAGQPPLAADLLLAIGEPARRALPVMKAALAAVPAPGTRAQEYDRLALRVAVARFDRAARPEAVAAIQEAVTGHDLNFFLFGLMSLPHMGAEARPAVADLVRLAEDPRTSPLLLPLFVATFREMGAAATPAIPLLNRLTNHKDAVVRALAAEALRAIRRPVD